MIAPFFHLERIEKQILELEKFRYRNKVELECFTAREDLDKQINPSPPEYVTDAYTVKVGDFWSGRDAYIWLHKELEICESWIGQDVVGVFDFGNTGIGNNSSFESLLYVNQKPYQGVDSNHKEAFFDLDALGNRFAVDFRLWSGLEGGGTPTIQYHQIKTAFIACLDKKTDDLYYFGKNIIDTIKVLDDNDYTKHQLEKIMIRTLQLVDFTDAGSEAFYESIAEADRFLNETMEALPKNEAVNVFCVGHTHIDMAWLWRLKHTREKASRSFTTVNQLMKRFDEYIFLQTQAQLYDYVKQDFPEIYEQIKQAVADKKWEPSGSMWVEADCNLTSGESLVRQILYGKNFFKSEFGYENTFLWLPDVFGYSWALPQILKKSGIDTFITTKISWNEVNRMPFDTFTWRGMDGTEIMTHFITTPDVCGDTKFYTYNGNILPKIAQGIWTNYRNKDLNQDLLLSYGYGDGGGGVNRDMLENRRRIEKIPGMPNIKTSNVTEYLEKLHDTVADQKNNGYRHVWDNELYLEFHRGTYTSQAYNKMMNRRLELKYRDAEILGVMAAVNAGDWNVYDQAGLTAGWKIILRNQFHDIIPGSSITEVYEDSKAEYSQADAIGNGLIDKAESAIFHEAQQCYSIINTAGWHRSSLVKLPVVDLEQCHFEDNDGNVLKAQNTGDETLVYLPTVAPVSAQRIFVKTGKTTAAPEFEYEKGRLTSSRYEIQWNEKGQLTSIFNKRMQRNALTGLGNVLEIFEDKPRNYDAWEMEATIDLKKTTVEEFLGAELLHEGTNAAKVRFRWRYHDSSIEQNLVLYADSDRIDFETKVDWRENDKLMKTAFSVDVRSTQARYDIQYGNVERPTHRSTTWDMAKFEVVGHQWADLSEKGFGVSLLNDCKYGYDIKDNVMRLSLLKAASFPDVQADRGVHHFTYSIYVHENAWYDSELIKEAWDLNAPMRVVPGAASKPVQLFEMNNESIVLDAVKRAENSNRIVMRFHETHGGKADMDLELKFPNRGWCEAGLMEEAIGPTVMSNRVQRTLKPYEIVTILVDAM